MVRLAHIFFRRGRQVVPGEDTRSHRHIKHGPVKWRDYKSPFVDPPYWYKWSLLSPYSPTEQARIRAMEDMGWYRYNYDKIKYTPPDKWLCHVGDRVEILTGKDKGKQGEVVQIVPQRNWVVIGGLNLKWRDNDGEMIAEELPLEHHEVSLVDPVDKKPTEIEFRADDKGNRTRVSRRSGHIIPMPLELLHDRKPKSEYVEQEKDTEEKFALERTFVPSMKLPEEELREIFKIPDSPKKETFWY